MDIKEMLSEIDIKQIYDEIYASPDYRKMAEKYQKLRASGNFAQMYVMAKKMKDYEIGVFEGIARRYIDKLRITNKWVSSMSEEDRKTLSILSYSVYMLSDVLQSYIMDINSLMKRTTEHTVCGFDKMNVAVKEAKNVVSHFDGTMGDEKAISLFGDFADDLYKMIFNKSSSYYKKLKKYAEETNKKATSDAKMA